MHEAEGFRLRINGRPVEGVISASRWSKTRGLLGLRSFEGFMVFPGVRQVHTWFMRFTILAAALAENGQIVEVREVQPFRVFTGPPGTVAVVECADTYALRTLLSPGARVEWERP